MTEPIVFIARFRVREGRLDEFREHYFNSIAPVQAGKPGTLAQVAYENEDGSEVMVVRLFLDAQAMDAQLQGSGERTQKTYEFVEPIRMEIYGMPSATSLEIMKKVGENGVAVSVTPRLIGGFVR
ncbi:MAG TPA: antibiotic biosynthesis monooxygenase [Anaerolineales bacterium]